MFFNVLEKSSKLLRKIQNLNWSQIILSLVKIFFSNNFDDFSRSKYACSRKVSYPTVLEKENLQRNRYLKVSEKTTCEELSSHCVKYY